MLKNAKEKLEPGERCDLCGTEITLVNDVSDDLGSCSICAGCAELWTAYLMHHPTVRRPRPLQGLGPSDRRSRPAG